MHHQTAKAGYRILEIAADLVDEKGYAKADAGNGKVTVEQAIALAAKGKSVTAIDAAEVAFGREHGIAPGKYVARDKRQAASALRRAAKSHALSHSINLEKV